LLRTDGERKCESVCQTEDDSHLLHRFVRPISTRDPARRS
jgi:hypothetical protein